MEEFAPVASEIVNKMESAIHALSAKLGVASEHLWVILIGQAQVVLYGYLTQIAIGIGAFIIYMLYVNICISKNYYVRRENIERYDIDPRQITHIIISAVFGIVFLIFAISAIIELIPNIFTCYFNPEYYALNKILAQIK